MDDPVVTSALEPEKIPDAHDRATGLLKGNRGRDAVDHAQRVTEGQMLAIHSNTWRYSRLLAEQREILAERRSALLMTEKAFEELTVHDPERSASLVEAHGRDAVVRGCREIMLWHLDRGWAHHLEAMNDVRESIHLRALGRENPLDEFHRIAIDHFRDLASDAVRESEKTFAEIEFTDSGVDLEANDMARPTSTWTYMVHDNPMAAGGNVFSGMMSTFR